MTSKKKFFFICPTWDYHPSGPIQLGNIILSPTTPGDPLNGSTRGRPESLFPATTKTNVTWSRDTLGSGRYGIWTNFLSFLGLGADAGVSHESSVDETYAFDEIETTEFIPTPEYLARNMASRAVVHYLERSRFRKHVYMITGIKAVRGARVKTATSQGMGMDLNVGLDASMGVPMSLGPEINVERKRGESSSFEGSSDFVFAFRLRKIVVHRSGEVTHAEYTKRAMYDADGDEDSSQLPFEVDGLAGEDASAGDFGLDERDVVDGDADCVCMQLR